MDAIYKFVPTVPTRLNKQPIWFNSDIRHHTNCLRALKRNFNQHPTLYNKLKYENSSNLLQDKISSAKANYESNLIFTFTTTNNSKVYKYIRSLTKSHSTPPTLHCNLTTANSDLEKANALNDYFYSIFSSASTNHHLPPSDTPTALSNISITEEDVYSVLINLDTSKAMGPDGIPPAVLSKCAPVLCKPLHHLFCLTLKYSKGLENS